MMIEDFSKEYLDIELRPHQILWLRFIQKHPWVLLLAPRGHGKSTIMYIFIVWSICMDPTLRVLIASHKEELANTFSRMVQMTLEREDIQARFGIVRGRPWRVDYFFFEGHRHPTVQTVAKQAGMTGGRYDMVVFDDLLTVENTSTEKRRSKIETWINSEVVPALDPSPKRKVVVVGTRKHLEDWYAKILNMRIFEHMTYSLYEMKEDGTKSYLWPERYDETEELNLRTIMTPAEFAREMMNKPIVEEGIRFKRKWLKFYDGSQELRLPDDRYLRYHIGIDPSMGRTGERTSNMGIVVVAFDYRPEEQKIYIVDMVRAKPSLAEQLEIIRNKVLQYEPQSTTIEYGLANQLFVDNVLEQLPFLTKHNPNQALQGTSEIAKIARIEQVAGYLFKHGYIYLKDPLIFPMSKEFIEYEYVQFPEGDKALLDALCMAVNALQVGKTVGGSPVRLHG